LEQAEIDGVFTVDDSFARRQDLLTKSGSVVPILPKQASHPGTALFARRAAKGACVAIDSGTGAREISDYGCGPAGIPADRVEILARRLFLACARNRIPAGKRPKSTCRPGRRSMARGSKVMIDELARSQHPM